MDSVHVYIQSHLMFNFDVSLDEIQLHKIKNT